jgi:hypothetical protein
VRLATYDGIDVCGERLANEVRALVAANPGLRRLSVISHSMGGLLARYAVGALFNPQEGSICGLAPRHFVAMATPHMGCDAEGLAQVPFIGWSAGIPLIGGPVSLLMRIVSVPVASALLGRTGEQFFLADGGVGGAGGRMQAQPLLVQMTSDVPERGARLRLRRGLGQWGALAVLCWRARVQRGGGGRGAEGAGVGRGRLPLA